MESIGLADGLDPGNQGWTRFLADVTGKIELPVGEPGLRGKSRGLFLDLSSGGR